MLKNFFTPEIRPHLEQLLAPFLSEVHKKSFAINKYYNWELADKDIVRLLLDGFAKILATREIARKGYIRVKPGRRRHKTFLFEEDLESDVINIFSVEFKNICMGFQADCYNDSDYEGCYDMVIDELVNISGRAFGGMLNLLLKEEIMQSQVLPKDLLLLVYSYAELGTPKKKVREVKKSNRGSNRGSDSDDS